MGIELAPIKSEFGMGKVPYRQVFCCRVCGAGLTGFWDGGLMQVVEFPRIGELPKKPRVPLQLVVCDSCCLVQLRHTTDPAYLYEEFWYRSRLNELMQRELRNIVMSAVIVSGAKAGDWILDIGCNDGTLLECYPEGLNLVGVDPAQNLNLSAERKWAFVCDYFSEVGALMASDGNLFKVVTAISVFYDLDDPVGFCQEVRHVLAPDGVFIVQMNYLPEMLKSGGVDNVCHEHLTYFSLGSLVAVFARAGLDVYRVELSAVNGGSIRAYGCNEGTRPIEESVNVALRYELEVMMLRTRKPYEEFGKRVKATCDVLNQWLAECQRAGKKVYAYGASTRGMTLLQLLEMDHRLIACAERNELKFGHYMAGVNLPIVSEKEFRENADVAFVLPWYFMESIFERESDWLAKGGIMIVPLPNPRIRGWDPWGVHGSGA